MITLRMGEMVVALRSAANIFGPHLLLQRLRMSDVKKILVLGNCTASPLSSYISAICEGVEVESMLFSTNLSGAKQKVANDKVSSLGRQSDHVFLLNTIDRPEVERLIEKTVIQFPVFAFTAYHPDLTYISHKSTGSLLGAGPVGEYNSFISFWAYSNGLNVRQAVSLFREDVFEALGYFSKWEASYRFLDEQMRGLGFGADLLPKWVQSGCFMHSVNHPKKRVLMDIAHALMDKASIATSQREDIADPLEDDAVWPIYPDIARRLGIDGGYIFSVPTRLVEERRVSRHLELEEFVEKSYDAFKLYDGDLHCSGFDDGASTALSKFLNSPPATRDNVTRPHPYKELPDHCFWRRSIGDLPSSSIDPVVNPRMRIGPDTKVSTAGSCFAQHISKTLEASGYNYFVAEIGAHLDASDARGKNYGTFSARYGNIYTSLQLDQLFDRAYGHFKPSEQIWRLPNGRYVDPFRPQIEPEGFDTEAAVEADRMEHFLAVRRVFEETDVFVFTLGLTEAWRSKIDGAVFPLAPGVAGGEFDPSRHEFVNFGVADVVSQLSGFVTKIRRVNPSVKIMLTVSPVPLAATFVDRHVLVSTSYSKSVLRVAAETICHSFQQCEYFPSYEIITGNFHAGAYYEKDLRNASSDGVAHVMRLFMKHYSGGATARAVGAVDASTRALKELSKIVCDEDLLQN